MRKIISFMFACCILSSCYSDAQEAKTALEKEQREEYYRKKYDNPHASYPQSDYEMYTYRVKSKLKGKP